MKTFCLIFSIVITSSLADAASPYNVVDYGADPTGKDDSAAAIASAITAASATGGTVYFPAGTYKTSKPLNWPQAVSFLGAGSTVTGATPTPTTIVNSISHIFKLSASISGNSIQNPALTSLYGGGHIFNFSGFDVTRTTFRNLGLQQDNPNESVLYSVCQNTKDCTVTGAMTFFGKWFEDIDAFYAPNTLPAFYIKNLCTNQLSFDKMRVTGAAGSANYAFWIQSTNSQGYAFEVTLRQITFELASGAGVNLLAATGTKISESGVYDMPAASVNPLINVGTRTAGLGSGVVQLDSDYVMNPFGTSSQPDLSISSGSVHMRDSGPGHVTGLGSNAARVIVHNSWIDFPSDLQQIALTNYDIEFDSTVTASKTYSFTPGSPGNNDGDFLIAQGGTLLGFIDSNGNFHWGSSEITSTGIWAAAGQTYNGAVAFSSVGPVRPAGASIYCTNCETSATCAPGGPGHMAVSNGGARTCQ
jgi:hypothetical protein